MSSPVRDSDPLRRLGERGWLILPAEIAARGGIAAVGGRVQGLSTVTRIAYGWSAIEKQGIDAASPA
jgi:hypothetical protein